MFPCYLKNFTLPIFITASIVILSACGGSGANTSVNMQSPANKPLPSTSNLAAAESYSTSSTALLTAGDVQGTTEANSAPQTFGSSSSADAVITPIFASTSNSKASSAANTVSSAGNSASKTSVVNNKASSVVSKSSVASSKASSLGASIEWAHPISRADGTYLNLDEIGGYDIRFKTALSSTYSHVDIKGNWVTSYLFPSPVLGLTFEIAVYDTNGIYSDYVAIN